MLRQKSDSNPGDDPRDGFVVLDPIGFGDRKDFYIGVLCSNIIKSNVD